MDEFFVIPNNVTRKEPTYVFSRKDKKTIEVEITYQIIEGHGFMDPNINVFTYVYLINKKGIKIKKKHKKMFKMDKEETLFLKDEEEKNEKLAHFIQQQLNLFHDCNLSNILIQVVKDQYDSKTEQAIFKVHFGLKESDTLLFEYCLMLDKGKKKHQMQVIGLNGITLPFELFLSENELKRYFLSLSKNRARLVFYT